MNVRENVRQITIKPEQQYKFVCLSFVFVYLEKFSSIEVFQLPVKCFKFGHTISMYVLHLRPLSTKGSFACHTDCISGHPFLWTSSRISNIYLHLLLTVWGWNFGLFDNSLGLSRQGFVLPTFHILHHKKRSWLAVWCLMPLSRIKDWSRVAKCRYTPLSRDGSLPMEHHL